jgi:hypothetical protein
MIRHVVLFTFVDTVTNAQVDALAAALDSLPGEISEIVTYRHGRDLGLSETNFDYAVTADLASEEDLAIYRSHPVHVRLIADHIEGNVADRAAVQFVIAD